VRVEVVTVVGAVSFERELKAALSELEKRYGAGKSKVTFGFWP
jgi:hypothetical protein